jgi:ribonuclease HII
LYPSYGFAQNKGYGTPEHLAALDRLGSVRDPPALVRARGANLAAVLKTSDETHRERCALQ